MITSLSAVVFSSTGDQHLVAAMFRLTGFVSGMNTVIFAVSKEAGGPTGLDVAFADAGDPPSGPALVLHHPAYPDAMTFSQTAEGDANAQTLSVVNNGDKIAVFAAIGPPTGNFSIDPSTQGCGAALEPGAMCAFKVVFTPATARYAFQTGALKISLQGAANPSTYTVNLAGTAGTSVSATGAPSLGYSGEAVIGTQPSPGALVYPPLVFPATQVGKVSVEQLVTITNNGSAPAIFSDIYYPSNFAINWKPATGNTPGCGAAAVGRRHQPQRRRIMRSGHQLSANFRDDQPEPLPDK